MYIYGFEWFNFYLELIFLLSCNYKTLRTLWIVMMTSHHPDHEHDCPPRVILVYFLLTVMFMVQDTNG